MKTKFVIIIIAIVMIAAFALVSTGAVKLPKGNPGSEAESTDRFVGFLLTKESLVLSIDDAELDGKAAEALLHGGTMEAGDVFGNERLYATLKQVEYTDEETGEKSFGSEYVFDIPESIRFFFPKVGEGEEKYHSVMNDGLSDVSQHVIAGDGDEGLEVTGTLYISAALEDAGYQFNSVYQTASGEVYAVPGEGMFTDPVEGSSMTYSQEDESSEGSGNEKKAYHAKVSVTLSFMYAPVATRLLQFNAENAVISSTELPADGSLERMTLLPVTAYLMVETQLRNAEGATRFTRELWAIEKGFFTYFVLREDGVLVKKYCWFGSED